MGFECRSQRRYASARLVPDRVAASKRGKAWVANVWWTRSGPSSMSTIYGRPSSCDGIRDMWEQRAAFCSFAVGLTYLSIGPAQAGEVGDFAGGFHILARGAVSPSVFSPPVTGTVPDVEPRDFVFAPVSLGLGIELELGARATPDLALTGFVQGDVGFVPGVINNELPAETTSFDFGLTGGLRARVGAPAATRYWFLDAGALRREYRGGTDAIATGYRGRFIDGSYSGGFVGGGLGFRHSWVETRVRASVGALGGNHALVFPVTLELHIGWAGG